MPRPIILALLMSGCTPMALSAQQALGRGPLATIATAQFGHSTLSCEPTVRGTLWPLPIRGAAPFENCGDTLTKTFFIRAQDSLITAIVIRLGRGTQHMAGFRDSLSAAIGSASRCDKPTFPEDTLEMVWKGEGFSVRLDASPDGATAVFGLGPPECAQSDVVLQRAGQDVFRAYLGDTITLDSAATALADVERRMEVAASACPSAGGGCLTAIVFPLDHRADSSRAIVLYDLGFHRVMEMQGYSHRPDQLLPTVRATLFLDYLKSGEDSGAPGQAFDVRNGGHWHQDRIPEFIAGDGITFSDVNTHNVWRATLADLQRQIKQRKGPSFEALVHLGHIYSIPYPQYSRLTWTQGESQGVMDVAGWYHVTLSEGPKGWFVSRIDYLQVEDE